MNSTLKFVTGLLLGGAIGLSAGLLLAPATGKQARKKISKKSKKLAKLMAGYIGMEDKVRRVPAKNKNGRIPVEAQ